MSSTAKEEINNILASIAEKNPKFKRRASQYTMIAKIATLIGRARTDIGNGHQHGHIIEVDAPTGTGKSLAHALPGIVMSRRVGKKFVISTATVGLQEQICESELPLLKSCMKTGLTYAIAKGRTRYVCPYRLDYEAGAAGQFSLIDEQDDKPSEDETKKRDEVIIHLHGAFNKREWDGDRDALGSYIVDDKIWRSISTDRHGCAGQNCPRVGACPFFAAKNKQENADVIVTNHDLLLADLSLGGGIILPAPHETIYAIDEAHHLPKTAIQSFSASHSVRSAMVLAERMAELFDGRFPIAIDRTERDAIATHSDELFRSMRDLHKSLAGWQSLEESDVFRFPFGDIPEEFYRYGANIAVSAQLVFGALEKVNEALNSAKEEMTGSPSGIDRAINDVSQLIVRLDNIYKVWTLMISETPEGAPPVAKWIKPLPKGDYLISASPISAASSLKNLFYDKAHAIVMTSATLLTLGKFDLFNRKSGLSFMHDKVEQVQLPSPFDFKAQGTLIIPYMVNDPKNSIGHTKEVIENIPHFVNLNVAEGNLVLFASRKQMEDVAAGIDKTVRQHIMLQGECTKDELLRRHREKIEKGQVSILFGLAGLSEGVDLPGKLCNRVIIAKLPFSVPTDPIEAAETEWLESIGRNAFSDIAVPSAAVKMNQSVGRLIRTEDDTGEVIVFDNRLARTNYGKMILKGLPPFDVKIYTEPSKEKEAA